MEFFEDDPALVFDDDLNADEFNSWLDPQNLSAADPGLDLDTRAGADVPLDPADDPAALRLDDQAAMMVSGPMSRPSSRPGSSHARTPAAAQTPADARPAAQGPSGMNTPRGAPPHDLRQNSMGHPAHMNETLRSPANGPSPPAPKTVKPKSGPAPGKPALDNSPKPSAFTPAPPFMNPMGGGGPGMSMPVGPGPQRAPDVQNAASGPTAKLAGPGPQASPQLAMRTSLMSPKPVAAAPQMQAQGNVPFNSMRGGSNQGSARPGGVQIPQRGSGPMRPGVNSIGTGPSGAPGQAANIRNASQMMSPFQGDPGFMRQPMGPNMPQNMSGPPGPAGMPNMAAMQNMPNVQNPANMGMPNLSMPNDMNPMDARDNMGLNGMGPNGVSPTMDTNKLNMMPGMARGQMAAGMPGGPQNLPMSMAQGMPGMPGMPAGGPGMPMGMGPGAASASPSLQNRIPGSIPGLGNATPGMGSSANAAPGQRLSRAEPRNTNTDKAAGSPSTMVKDEPGTAAGTAAKPAKGAKRGGRGAKAQTVVQNQQAQLSQQQQIQQQRLQQQQQQQPQDAALQQPFRPGVASPQQMQDPNRPMALSQNSLSPHSGGNSAYLLSDDKVRSTLAALTLYTQALRFGVQSINIAEVLKRVDSFDITEQRTMVGKFEQSRKDNVSQTASLPVMRILPQIFWRTISEVYMQIRRPMIPEQIMFAGKRIPLMMLFQYVQLSGGFIAVSLGGRWPQIASALGITLDVEGNRIVDLIALYVNTMLSFEMYADRNDNIRRSLVAKLGPPRPAPASAQVLNPSMTVSGGMAPSTTMPNRGMYPRGQVMRQQPGPSNGMGPGAHVPGGAGPGVGPLSSGNQTIGPQGIAPQGPQAIGPQPMGPQPMGPQAVGPQGMPMQGMTGPGNMFPPGMMLAGPGQGGAQNMPGLSNRIPPGMSPRLANRLSRGELGQMGMNAGQSGPHPVLSNQMGPNQMGSYNQMGLSTVGPSQSDLQMTPNTARAPNQPNTGPIRGPGRGRGSQSGVKPSGSTGARGNKPVPGATASTTPHQSPPSNAGDSTTVLRTGGSEYADPKFGGKFTNVEASAESTAHGGSLVSASDQGSEQPTGSFGAAAAATSGNMRPPGLTSATGSPVNRVIPQGMANQNTDNGIPPRGAAIGIPQRHPAPPGLSMTPGSHAPVNDAAVAAGTEISAPHDKARYRMGSGAVPGMKPGDVGMGHVNSAMGLAPGANMAKTGMVPGMVPGMPHGIDPASARAKRSLPHGVPDGAKRQRLTSPQTNSSAFTGFVEGGQYLLQRQHTSTHGGRNVRYLASLGNEIENWWPDVAFPLDLGTVDLHAVTCSLASRTPAEVRQALDKLAAVSANPKVHESVQHCPRLLANLCNLILSMLHQVLQPPDKGDSNSQTNAYALKPCRSRPVNLEIDDVRLTAQGSSGLQAMYKVLKRLRDDPLKEGRNKGDIEIEFDPETGFETGTRKERSSPSQGRSRLQRDIWPYAAGIRDSDEYDGHLNDDDEIDACEEWGPSIPEFVPNESKPYYFPSYSVRYERIENEICSLGENQDEKSTFLLTGLCDRLLLATCVLRNLSFSVANRPVIAHKPEFQRLLWEWLQICAENPNLLDTELRTLDLCKDFLTVLGNVGLYLRLPDTRKTLDLMLFLLSFSPAETPYTADGRIKLMDYDIDVHRYLPNAIDVFVKVALREDPNRRLIEDVLLGTSTDPIYHKIIGRWLKAQNRTEMYPAELLTRMFSLAVAMLPLTHFRPPSRDIETRQPYLLQGSLAAEVIVNMIPDKDVLNFDIAASWLNSIECFGARLVRTMNFMGMVVLNQPDGESQRPFAKITQRCVHVVQKLFNKAKLNPSFQSTGIVPSIEHLLGGLMAAKMDKTVVKHLSTLFDENFAVETIENKCAETK